MVASNTMQGQVPVDVNSYLIIILALMLGVFLIETFADLLNVLRMRPELPAEFQGIYDPEKYRKAIEYQREGTRFGFVKDCVFFVITVFFILAGGFERVDLFARSFAFGEIGTGLIFVAALSILRGILSLPFSYYDTFVIEEKYGFNKTTHKTFFVDLLKGTLLGATLGAPIFAGIIWFFEKTGSHGWLYAWLAFTAFSLLLSFFAPAVILPLFNKFEPLPGGELKAEIERFAHTQNFKLSGIFRMDSSKRSTKSNAFFTGFGRFRRLVLFDTLIEKHTRDELVAVLAHEIGHFKCRHIPRTIALSIVITGAIFYVVGFFMKNPGLFAAFGVTNLSVYASLVFAGFLYSPILRMLSIFSNLLSRKHEFEADEYAVRTYGRPEELISALKKLSIDNLSNLTPHPLKVLLDYTHPPILRRIEVIRSHQSMRSRSSKN